MHHSQRVVINDNLIHFTNSLDSTVRVLELNKHKVAVSSPIKIFDQSKSLKILSEFIIGGLGIKVTHEYL